jgi:hypothetical protein
MLLAALIAQGGPRGKAAPAFGWAVLAVAAVLVVEYFAVRACRDRRRP